MIKEAFLFTLFSTPFISLTQERKDQSANSIVIQGEVPPGYLKSDISLKFFPTSTVRIGYTSDDDSTIDQKVINRYVKWEYNVAYPVDVTGTFLKNKYFSIATFEPGDSITVGYRDGNMVFSGHGHEKLQLLYKMGKLSDSLENEEVFKSLSHKNAKPSSLKDYLLLIDLINKKEQLVLPLIDQYRSKLSDFGYNNIKEQFLYKLELLRVEKFLRLRGNALAEKKPNGELVNQYGLTNKDLAAICDSTQKGAGANWVEFEAPLVNDPYYLLKKLTLEAYRENGSFIKNVEPDTSVIGEGVHYWARMYEMGRKKYTGIRKEALLSFILWYSRGSIYFHGFVPEVEAMLADYYQQSQFPRYKEYTRKYELERRESYNAKMAPEFKLSDANGQEYTRDKLKGKVAILDFWFTGCTGCVQMAPALRKVEEEFKGDTNVVFLNISIDKDKLQWLRSVKQEKYTSGAGIHVYTNGLGSEHDMIKKYGVDGYPFLFIVDPTNRVLRPNPRPDPRKDNGKAMIALIKKQLAYMKDGPYVFYGNDSVTIFSIAGSSVTNKKCNKITQALIAQTDIIDKTFRFPIQRSLHIPPAEYARPEKLLVPSDIEGNFDAFRKLLQANKVMDANFDWTFGTGHLVFAGDMFDRGDQVTECLWLIYSLEEKAARAGGVVHFILGNHEHMNLVGNYKYTQQKYIHNAGLMGRNLANLYNEHSELGRWLRTKNIIEKIGDLLFIHGGVSRKLNQTPITVSQINQLARPYYASYKKDYGDERVNAILSDKIGPLWYRGYYQSGDDENMNMIMQQVIDSTLQKFSVNHIITGHTIVADTVSIHYGSKIINTDTRHADGKSEALLIEANNYYRVNGRGDKVLLFIDDKVKESSGLPAARL